ncbi:MAG: NUDIX hydrolase [Burkholderiales bacterium]|nr:NUDIX hydrolase [Burkholderiales bacterium]
MAASTSDPAAGDDRLYPARPILAASVAVFRDGHVLVASRTKPPGDAVFSLPGGVVEIGETLAEAALRELAEEVGVVAEIVGFAGHVEVIEPDGEGGVKRHFVVNAFAGRWVSGEPVAGPEAAETFFVAPDDIASLRTTPGLAGIVARAKAVLEAAS